MTQLDSIIYIQKKMVSNSSLPQTGRKEFLSFDSVYNCNRLVNCLHVYIQILLILKEH